MTNASEPVRATSSAPGARRRRLWILLAVVVSVPIAAIGVFAALVWISLSGGLDDAFSGDVPRVGDAEVVAAEERVRGPLLDAVREDSELVIAPVLGDGAGTLGTSEPVPSCTEGQHNWKIDDDFDLFCDLPVTDVVGVTRQEDFRRQMVRLDAALRADGWVPQATFDMDRVLTDYWDSLADAAPPGQADRYSMDNLPSAGYSRQLDGLEHGLTVGWAEHGSDEMAVGSYGSESKEFRTPAGETLAAGALLEEIPAEGYAVVLTHSVQYFRE